MKTVLDTLKCQNKNFMLDWPQKWFIRQWNWTFVHCICFTLILWKKFSKIKKEANILFQPSCWTCCEDFKHFYHQAQTEPSPWFHFYCIKPFMKTISNSSSSPSSSSLSSQLSSGKSVVMWSVLCARAPPPLAPWAPARSPALPRFEPSFVPFLSLSYFFVLL